MREIVLKLIFIGYGESNPFLPSIYKGMCVYLFMNIFFSFLYWHSFLSSETIQISRLYIDVPSEMPVRYLANNFTYTFFVSLPVTFAVIALDLLYRRTQIATKLRAATPASRENPIRRIYNGEIKSFLWPTKNGYVRLLISFFLFEGIALAAIYSFSSIAYDHLYNNPLLNMFIDFQAQNINAFMAWNFILLFILQVSIGGVFLGLLLGFQIIFMWKQIKHIYGISN